MADMVDCGISVRAAWKRNAEHITRYLGPYRLDMPVDEVIERLDMAGKISDEGLAKFRRGFSQDD